MRTPLCVWLLVMLATETVLAAQTEVIVTLARDGEPAATIVISKEPTRAAQFAAYELQWHLKQITGGDFRIVDEDEPAVGLAILVGDSQRVRAMGIPSAPNFSDSMARDWWRGGSWTRDRVRWFIQPTEDLRAS